jgi:hypothetical protein
LAISKRKKYLLAFESDGEKNSHDTSAARQNNPSSAPDGRTPSLFSSDDALSSSDNTCIAKMKKKKKKTKVVEHLCWTK